MLLQAAGLADTQLFDGHFSCLTMVLATISSLFLPETLGMPMSQTMEEAESNYFKTPEDIEREREEAEKGLKNENFKDEEL